jgi:hypothetical protein
MGAVEIASSTERESLVLCHVLFQVQRIEEWQIFKRIAIGLSPTAKINQKQSTLNLASPAQPSQNRRDGVC